MVPVPQSITPLQAHRALLAAGWLAAVIEFISAEPQGGAVTAAQPAFATRTTLNFSIIYHIKFKIIILNILIPTNLKDA